MSKLIAALLLLAGLTTAAAAQDDSTTQQHRLLERLRTGEALHREDLIQDALTRLQLIAPDDPETLLAGIREALRQNDTEQAHELLARLSATAPGSGQLQQGQRLLQLQSADNRRLLQQARLLAAAGRAEEALRIYERLLGSPAPSFELALEQEKTRSAIPAQQSEAIERLRALDRLYPGNVELRQTLTNLLFAADRDTEALDVLRQLATDHRSREAAAQREFDHLAERPVSAASARAWEDFLARYTDTPLAEEARRRLAEQRELLADPAWQAGQRGQQLLARGDNAGAEVQLRRALTRYPADANLHGSLGYALTRQGKHAEAHAAFGKAVSLEKDSRRIGKWRDMLASSEYWMLLQQAEQAAEAQDNTTAERLYRLAHNRQPRSPHALLGLGRLAMAAGQYAEAETLLLQAHEFDPDNSSSIRALVNLYRQESIERAERFLDGLPAAQRRSHAELRRDLRRQRLDQEAQTATENGQWARVVELLEEARILAPEDPWLVYRLANAQRELGEHAMADQSFLQLLQRRSDDASTRYAHSLYLSGAGRDQEALATLEHIPTGEWTEGMHAQAARLQRRILLATAEALRAEGREAEAEAMLLRDPLPDDYVRVGNWAALRNDHAKARHYYQQALNLEPEHPEAHLGLAESFIERNQPDDARARLAQMPALSAEQVNLRRRLANAWAGVGENAQAQAIYTELLQSAPPTGDPLLYRDAARFYRRTQPNRALDLYAQGMASAGLLPPAHTDPRNDAALTLASRANDEDDWLRRSLRSDVDALYQRRNPTLHLQYDFGWRHDDATPGLSDLDARTTMLHLDLPLAHGQAFLRAERVEMDAGRFDTDENGLHRREFGTCALQWRHRPSGGLVPAGCPGDRQRTEGVGLALGWDDEVWEVDVGRSPNGFRHSNWLGGVTRHGDWGEVGWRLTASRRPMSNSLLSYAGARDPQTGRSWGGVTANGLTLGLSYDRGGAHGVWASFGQHWLRGKNVANNQRRTAMFGYYYKAIDRANERARIGANLLYWGYDRDLGEYTLGHGGYYSPQHYLSVGMPLSYARRNADWSVLLEGAVSVSFARSSDSALYPLSGSLPDPDEYELVSGRLRTRGGSSSGIGVRILAAAERRLSDHAVFGAAFHWRHSRDYAPSYALLYLRYTFEPWRGNLPLPVQPLTPYADFR